MATIRIASPAFEDGGRMPARFAAKGDNLSPPLSWDEPPAGTASLALIVEDIDLPIPKALLASWVHWIVYDIPPDARGLPEGVPADVAAPCGGEQGRTSAGNMRWNGPAPVGGEHRYVFRIYALDARLDLPPRRATKAVLMKLMEGHILAQGELVGRYEKERR